MHKYTLQHKVAYIPTPAYLQDYWLPQHFIQYCQACHNYNKSWACPPFDFEPRAVLEHYPHTYILGTQVVFTAEFKAQVKQEKSAQTAGSAIMYEVRALLDKQLLALEKDTVSRAYYAGSCHLCPEQACTRSFNQPCRQPAYMRPSLEAFGFDIGKATSQLLNLELVWGAKGELPPYYILVSGWMTKKGDQAELLEKAINIS